MTKFVSQFIHERARQLAIVHLTRIAELEVQSQKGENDDGLDLMVTITRNGVRTGRLFGVQVKALMTAPAEPLVMGKKPLNGSLSKWSSDLPFPVCLFVFSMADDAGYFTWLNATDSFEQLSFTPLPVARKLEPLDQASLKKIIAQVTAWYDERLKIAA